MKRLLPIGFVCLFCWGCSAPPLPPDVLREIAAAESRKEVVRVGGGSGTAHIVLKGRDPDAMIDALQKLVAGRADEVGGCADYADRSWICALGCDDWIVGFESPDKYGMCKVEIASKGTAAYRRIMEL